ncbi:MAG TPA: MEDS domain-containing protein [Terriglobales bacterium]|jgi:hypothetical protein|nr:MEDS domain-containing protein [Terriglobales bacterium]
MLRGEGDAFVIYPTNEDPEPSLSGSPSPERQHQTRDHLVQFYCEDDQLLASLQRVVGGALGSGDSAVVVATEEHRRGLAKRLKWCGIDLQFAQACGRYYEVDAATVLESLEGHHTPLDFQELLQNTVFRPDCPVPVDNAGMLVFGEVVGLMWERNRRQEAVRLEDFWNRFQATRPFTLLCAYPVRRFHVLEDLEPFTEVCAAHSAIVSDDARISIVSEWRQSGKQPQWVLLHKSAMLEPDQDRLFKKVEAAEAAILTQIEKSAPYSRAQRNLLDALARLLILKRQKLNFN